MLQEYDYYTLFTELQFLISLFRKEACQYMFSNQQESFILLLKYRIHCKKSDCTYFSIKKLKIQYNKYLFFIIEKLQSHDQQFINSLFLKNSKLIR